MESWYAVYTKPNAEVQVARALDERGYGVYLPLLPARAGRRSRPLFPAYVFVRFDLAGMDAGDLRWLPGMRCVLEFDGRPAIVPDEAICTIETGLQEIEAAGGVPGRVFKPGDRVVIDEGPLAGLRGVFEGPLKSAERVRILIRFLGETNRAEVPADVLRRAPDDEFIPRRRGTRGRGRAIRRER